MLRGTKWLIKMAGPIWMIVLISATLSLKAQGPDVFSGDVKAFDDELYFFMQKNIQTESEQALEEFLNAYTRDSLFAVPEKEALIRMANALNAKNGKPHPHFTHFLKAVLRVKQNPAKPANFATWGKGLMGLLLNNEITLASTDRFLTFTRLLADSGSLYRSGSVDWRITTPDYDFVLDTTVSVRVTQTTLVCYAKNDSMHVYETGGFYYPLTNTWRGNGGLVTWERAGFPRNEVFARLARYEISLSRSEYIARDAVFTNLNYFDKPLQGILTDKVKLNRNAEDADYPQFDSYQKDFQINNLYKDINYRGGLSIQGSKLVGSGNRMNPAQVFIYRQDTLVVIARSQYFAFKPDRINAPRAEIVLRIRNDSVYHPGLALGYFVPGRELTLFRTDNVASQSPYFNSYHNIDMSFEQLVWKLNEPVMRFTAMMGSTISYANFESVNFFNNNKYQGMQLMDEVHPIVSIRSFAKRMGTESFLAEDFAGYLKKPLAQVKQLLMRMAIQGFVFYDSETTMATIRPRLHDYLAASVSRIDYDVLSIPSQTSTPQENALFDLRTFDLTIFGIPQIFVSDSQNVVIFPENERITMKKNRHFEFNGVVRAGLLTYSGKGFFFNYDTFKIDMRKIDSLQIRYTTGQVDNFGFPVTELARNLIEDLRGELLIDEPDNKSGRKRFPRYPVFRSLESGHVYYDGKEIQNGVYARDRFFFRLNPFEMDSIDNFNRESMRFDGTLQSSGIFTPIDETLRLQPDKSLGFQHFTPDSGMSVYGGKGVFNKLILLSNEGLMGKGTLHYLASATRSDDLVFYPDSVNAMARQFTMAENTVGTSTPQVMSSVAQIHWEPYSDQMAILKKEENFNMYSGKAILSGDLLLTPGGLTGEGRLLLEGAELISDEFRFAARKLNADTADFYLKSLHKEGFTVLTDNMKSEVNFDEQSGAFSSNEEFTLVSFPENKYVSYLDQFNWDMKRKELAMGSKAEAPPAVELAEEDLSGPRYISTDPAQDSLSFIAPLAVYDYDSNLIKASAVKYIDIADARIYPENEMLTVEANARLRTLYKSILVANRNTRYHTLGNATLTIGGRNDFTGTGYYNYEDETGLQQLIFFSALGVEDSLITTGTGSIAEPDGFTLSPNYAYQGKVFLRADKKFLTFDGGVAIEHMCDNLQSRWLNFRSEIDPVNIMIPVSDPMIDINRNKIFNGLFMYYDSVHVYPAFLTARKNYSDNPVATAGGYLYYDKEKQQYQIAEKTRLLDPGSPGNLVSMHRETCELYGEGKLDLGAKLGQVKLTAAGNALHKPASNETELDLLLAIDFFAAEPIINLMAAEIDSVPNLPATDLNRPAYVKGIIDMIGKARYSAMRAELGLFGSLRETPSELRHTLFFNELKLRWNNESNSWISVGKIGIASINNVQINKRVDGLIEFQIKRSGDLFDIYLQVDRRTWYYFGYTRGVMNIHTSNGEIIDRMMKMKPNERRQNVATGESYIYMVATEVKKNTFQRKFRERQGGE